MDITLRMSDHALTARAAAAAGIVLLQNKNRTLPLLPQEDGAPLPVAVFGIKQLQTPAFDKTMTPWRAIGVLDGLAASETVRPDALLARKYRTWAVEHPEGSEMPLTTLDFGALRHDCAAAVIVIGRTPERYSLQLTDEETAMLTRVTSVFDRTVLVLAAPGFIELNEAALSCGAIVFLGLAGQEAGGALADVLTAKVMPAGHLSFSWPECAEAFADACAATDQFTGYRYFDSFGVPVRYPFGHGLSYGTVAFGSVSAGLDGCDVTVSAELVNTGEEFAASELVQVYVTRPEGDLTRPVSFLDCFQKSRLLAPGESQTVTLRFPITELSVYREHAHAFVLDAGYYDIRIGTSSRACYLAGSIRLTRSAVVQAAEPLTLSAAQERTRPENVCFQFPEDLAEIEQAHKHAIRFSDRNLPRRSRRKGREFTGCRPDGAHHTLADVREGRCSVFHLVADMDTENLERLVCGFGREAASVPGALGASAAIERYGIPAVQIAGGAQGVLQFFGLLIQRFTIHRRGLRALGQQLQIGADFGDAFGQLGDGLLRLFQALGMRLQFGGGIEHALLLTGHGNFLLMHGLHALVAQTFCLGLALLHGGDVLLQGGQRLLILGKLRGQLLDFAFARKEIAGFAAHGAARHGAAGVHHLAVQRDQPEGVAPRAHDGQGCIQILRHHGAAQQVFHHRAIALIVGNQLAGHAQTAGHGQHAALLVAQGIGAHVGQR